MRKVVSMFIAILLLTSMSFAYTLKVTVDGIDLEVTREPGNLIKLNEKIAEIKGWDVKTGNVTIENNEFVMPEEDVVIEAILEEEVGKYLLTVENLFARTRERKTEGQSVTVEATSYDGYNFLSWIASGIELTEEQKKSSTITFTMPGQEVALEAIYEMISLEWDTTGQLEKTLILKTTAKTVIDWGDGTVEIYAASPTEEQTITHTYTVEQNYPVKLGGDDNITYFKCQSSQVTNLDVSKASNLTKLVCPINNIASIDVSKNKKLLTLSCGINELQQLDVSNNLELEELWCNTNAFTELDLSKNTKLKILECQVNNIGSLDFSNNYNLEKVWAFSNNISSIDVSKCTKLQDLNVGNNVLTELDVSNNYELTILKCYQNNLTVLDVTNNTQLETLKCHQNSNLTTLNIGNNANLSTLAAGFCGLTELDISGATSLSTADCYQESLLVLYVNLVQAGMSRSYSSGVGENASSNTLYLYEGTTIIERVAE